MDVKSDISINNNGEEGISSENTTNITDTNNIINNSEYTVDDFIESIGFGFTQIRVLIFASLVWMADSFEVMILAVLTPSVECQWNLTANQGAIITTVVFTGMAIGSPIWGILCDRYGRRIFLLITSIGLVISGLITSFVPSYAWLLIVRFIVGIFVSATPQSITYASEFMPVKYRSTGAIVIGISWAIGSCLEALLAFIVMPTLGWRYLVALSTIPAIIAIIYFPFVPKSPRYLISKNKLEEAEKVLETCGRHNCKKPLEGVLVAQKTENSNQIQTGNAVRFNNTNDIMAPLLDENRTRSQYKRLAGNFLELLSRKYIRSTCLLSIIWFFAGFVYYGIILLSTLINNYETGCNQQRQFNVSSNANNCVPLTHSDYTNFLITSSAELPGILITLFLCDIIGRKITIFSEYATIGGIYFLLLICYGAINNTIQTILIFMIRGIALGGSQATYIYTSEVYPTHIRATSLSLFSGLLRFGAVITPLFAQSLIKFNYTATIIIYGSLAEIVGVCAILLKLESKGRRLDNIEREIYN